MDPLRLVQILDSRIRRCQSSSSSGSQLLEESLRRFELVRCYNNVDLVCALKALEQRGEEEEAAAPSSQERPRRRLVLVDDISAFYWIDKSFDGGPGSALVARRPADRPYGLQGVFEAIASNLRGPRRLSGRPFWRRGTSKSRPEETPRSSARRSPRPGRTL